VLIYHLSVSVCILYGAGQYILVSCQSTQTNSLLVLYCLCHVYRRARRTTVLVSIKKQYMYASGRHTVECQHAPRHVGAGVGSWPALSLNRPAGRNPRCREAGVDGLTRSSDKAVVDIINVTIVYAHNASVWSRASRTWEPPSQTHVPPRSSVISDRLPNN